MEQQKLYHVGSPENDVFSLRIVQTIVNAAGCEETSGPRALGKDTYTADGQTEAVVLHLIG